MFLHVSDEVAKKHGVTHTKAEILQQPRLWKEAYEYIFENKETIYHFFQNIWNKHDRVKVIFTGAGTSAFIGECITPYLHSKNVSNKLSIEQIATTNIVSNPAHYLIADIPTLMVSFARSGSSPESVASVELGEKLITNFYKLHITCNPDGYLATKYKDDLQSLLLLMPDGSNDKGFAMTSSYSSMMLSSLLVFQLSDLDGYRDTVCQIADRAEWIQTHLEEEINELAEKSISNIVYLGSGPLLGLAHEASLKMLELTDGNVFTSYDSPLGFRHGPKAIIKNQTLIVMFLSNDSYTRQYDMDMLKELAKEKASAPFQILVISDEWDENLKSYADYYFSLRKIGSDDQPLDDVYLAFPYIFIAQIFAVSKSLNLGFSPDNPSKNGSVNRVVQGVNIYPFEQ